VFSATTDLQWDSIPLSHWNCVEVNVAIVCACLMTMKPLIDKLWPRLLDPPSNEAPLDVESDEKFVVGGNSGVSANGTLSDWKRSRPSDMIYESG
jgi:hypothetical protein